MLESCVCHEQSVERMFCLRDPNAVAVPFAVIICKARTCTGDVFTQLLALISKKVEMGL